MGVKEGKRRRAAGQSVKRDKWAVSYGLDKQVAWRCHCWQGSLLAHPLLLKSGNSGISFVHCVLVSEDPDIRVLHSFG